MPPKRSSRSIALDILLSCGKTAHNASDLLDRALSGNRIPPRDAAFVTELVYGIIRMRGTLDWIIEHLAQRDLRRIPGRTLMCLRLGIYQIAFLDKVPEYAAVSESVGLAKARGNGKAGSFVNALLRKYLSLRDNVPFPDMESDPLAHLSVVHSHPRFLVERWLQTYGPETTARICAANNSRPPVFIRVNTLNTTAGELSARIRSEGAEAEQLDDYPDALRLSGCHSPSALPSFREGLFYIQDLSTLRAPRMLDPRPGDTVLDCCAAPGGKTTHVAQLMQGQGRIVACDSDPSRLARLKDNLDRLGISIIDPLHCDALNLSARISERFTRVLADVPCSNTGVLKRRVEARWRLTPDDFEKLPKLQLAILESASALVDSGGVLLYSTCSIDPAENQEVSTAFHKAHPEFELAREEAFLPETDGPDGGYLALFERSV